MTVRYKLQPGGVLDQETGRYIQEDTANYYWKKFLSWQSDGNTPDPYQSDEEILADAKSVAIKITSALANTMMATGFEYPDSSGNFVQIAPEDMGNLNAAALRAMNTTALGSWPSDFYWILADNSHLSVPTAADMIALFGAAWTAHSGIIVAARAKKDSIDSAEDMDALNDIDLDTL